MPLPGGHYRMNGKSKFHLLLMPLAENGYKYVIFKNLKKGRK